MALLGGALRLLGTFLYVLLFLLSAGILGIWSYFVAALVQSHTGLEGQWIAIEVLSAVATAFCIFAILLTCFLGGNRFFATVGIVMDIIFMGAMIAIAVMVRRYVQSCSGFVNTILGTGTTDSISQTFYNPRLATICKLQLAVFALAVIGAVLFLLAALVQFFISRHHVKEKKNTTVEERFPKDAEAGVIPAPVVAYEPIPRTTVVRPSHDTTYTEATAVGHNDFGNGTLNKMEHKIDRAILPPVVDAPVSNHGVASRAETRAEVAAVPHAPFATYTTNTSTDYYNAPATVVGHAGAHRPEPAGADVAAAIYGHHDNNNTGRF